MNWLFSGTHGLNHLCKASVSSSWAESPAPLLAGGTANGLGGS